MGKIVVLTGAASGIGRASATRLAAAGWTVVMLDRAFDTAWRAVDARSFAMHCDVSEPASVEAAFAAIDTQLGTIDALVCSAGTLRIGAIVDMSIADFDALYHVNTRGAWLVARAAVQLMRKRRDPAALRRIVFVGSISAIRPKVGNGAYGAQKAALHTLTGVMAAELGGEGILVNAVAPGTVDTPMIQAMQDASQTGRYRPSGTSPLGRVAQPEDVAAVIEFYLGDQSNYVTGTVIPVDGGTRAAFVPPAA
ncbi:SDR family NAD(P)-dependent oxidoreductase [Chitinasiproducens palmae]|uniref:3-oxoacyl-[acyl-carrier protein] reductase n=1 Tax=Chitinasiproducens palmae TaxID=1770053 RepID=A0A1H2PUA1_9BURK|nr:SDR family oxidoreductase [Chitinasiproducens palmae]SDV50738.1 3-oxoacyl-[acyl-carrier protein] reductase [Chitinasiproducens palmae]